MGRTAQRCYDCFTLCHRFNLLNESLSASNMRKPMQTSDRLATARREQFFELAAIEPDAMAVGAGIQDHAAVDGAVNS